MKNYALIIVPAVFAIGLFAQSPSSLSQSQPVQVFVQSEVRDLAKGFAKAYSELSRPPITLIFQREGVVRTLEDIKQVKDSDGVLVVEVGKGLIYLLNPKDVLYITDGGPVKVKDLGAPAPR